MDWTSCLQDGIPTLGCIPIVIGNLVRGAIIFAGITAVLLVIYSGIKYITSGGDAKQVEGARNTLTYAIIGLILIILSFAIVNILATFLPGLGCSVGSGFSIGLSTCQ